MVALRMMPAVRSLLNNWNTLGRNRTVVETLNQALHGDPSPYDRAPVRRPFGAEAGAGGRRSHHPGPETHTVNNFGGSMPATGSVRTAVLEAPPESGKAAPLPFERTIEFRHLSFRYPDAGEDLLHDLSFTLRKGERLGICASVCMAIRPRLWRWRVPSAPAWSRKALRYARSQATQPHRPRGIKAVATCDS